jgi:hypothetical protein
MEKLFINICKLISILCLLVIILGRFPDLGTPFLIKELDVTRGGVRYSDMYGSTLVSDFEEYINYTVAPPETGDFFNADIYLNGDSFFWRSINNLDFEAAFKERTNLHVVDLYKLYDYANFYPVKLFEEKKLMPDKDRILILEVVERFAPERTLAYNREVKEYHYTYASIDNTLNDIFSFYPVNFFVRSNIFLKELIKFKADFTYHNFNQLHKVIGAYSVNPNILFLGEDVNFSKKIKTDDEINTIAENLSNLSEKLEKYRIHLVYVLIPDKYSIYNEYVNGVDKYDNFLPRVNAKLTEKKVNVIDLYSIYSDYKKNNNTWLYFLSDTHYNGTGRSILIDECLKKINEIRQDNKREDVTKY